MVTRLNQTDFVKTALRLPPDLHARLHEAADASGRSYNAEIVARLHRSFDNRDTELAQDTVGATLKSLQHVIKHVEMLSKRLELIEKKRS